LEGQDGFRSLRRRLRYCELDFFKLLFACGGVEFECPEGFVRVGLEGLEVLLDGVLRVVHGSCESLEVILEGGSRFVHDGLEDVELLFEGVNARVTRRVLLLQNLFKELLQSYSQLHIT
jgi:hypothetical protein